MTIYLASDHAGFALKEACKKELVKEHHIIDCGAFSYEPVDDYPLYMKKAAELVARNPVDRAFLFGGSGQGEAMVANRFKGVRCAVFYGPMVAQAAVDAEGHTSKDPFEMIKLEREHNDANILSLGARFVSADEAKKAIRIFLETSYGQAQRHARRIAQF